MILICSKLITCEQNRAPINNGAVVISRGTILAVGNAVDILKKFSRHRIRRFQDSVLMPGLVNVHAHLEIPHLLDRVRAKTFPDWILNLIQAKKGLSKLDYRSATRENLNTLIHTGTTTVAEICTHAVSPALLKQRGLRAVVFREVIEMRPSATMPHFFSSLLSRHSSVIQSGISPHTPYTVSEPVLRAINQFSKKRDIRLAMHIAESKEEINLLQRIKSGLEKLYQYAGWDLDWAPKGSSSFEYLERLGFLSPSLLAVHCVQVTDEDIKQIRKEGTSVAHCPRSNKELGVGRMPLKKFLDAGIVVGLGTDSLASSPTLNLWDEMRYAYRIHRRDGITPRDLLALATIGGAKAFGLDNDIGTIEAGKKADIVAVPLPKKNTGDPYSDLLRETKSCIMAMVNGIILFHDGDPNVQHHLASVKNSRMSLRLQLNSSSRYLP